MMEGISEFGRWMEERRIVEERYGGLYVDAVNRLVGLKEERGVSPPAWLKKMDAGLLAVWILAWEEKWSIRAEWVHLEYWIDHFIKIDTARVDSERENVDGETSLCCRLESSTEPDRSVVPDRSSEKSRAYWKKVDELLDRFDCQFFDATVERMLLTVRASGHSVSGNTMLLLGGMLCDWIFEFEESETIQREWIRLSRWLDHKVTTAFISPGAAKKARQERLALLHKSRIVKGSSLERPVHRSLSQ